MSITDQGLPDSIQIGKAGNNYFDGTVDEVRVYSRKFSPAEIQDLYEWAPGPVGYWKMDEGTGTGADAVKDTSGNNYHGTMQSAMSESDWVSGKYGNALDFKYLSNYGVEGSDVIVDGFPFTMMALP
jgi:hypothetical protein